VSAVIKINAAGSLLSRPGSCRAALFRVCTQRGGESGKIKFPAACSRARNFSAALKAASYSVRVKFLLYEITYKQVIISDFSLAGCGVAAD